MNINLRRGQQGNWEGNMGCTDFDLPAYNISEYIFGNMFFQMNTQIKLDWRLLQSEHPWTRLLSKENVDTLINIAMVPASLYHPC